MFELAAERQGGRDPCVSVCQGEVDREFTMFNPLCAALLGNVAGVSSDTARRDVRCL